MYTTLWTTEQNNATSNSSSSSFYFLGALQLYSKSNQHNPSLWDYANPVSWSIFKPWSLGWLWWKFRQISETKVRVEQDVAAHPHSATRNMSTLLPLTITKQGKGTSCHIHFWWTLLTARKYWIYLLPFMTTDYAHVLVSALMGLIQHMVVIVGYVAYVELPQV